MSRQPMGQRSQDRAGKNHPITAPSHPSTFSIAIVVGGGFMLLCVGLVGWSFVRSNEAAAPAIRRAPQNTEPAATPSLEKLSEAELETILNVPPQGPASVANEIDDNSLQEELEQGLVAFKKLYPLSAEGEHLHGLVHLRLKQTAQAEPYLRRSMALAPSNQQMRLDTAELLMQAGRDAEALEVLQTKPNGQTELSPEYLAAIGDCQQRLGNTSAAVESFQIASGLAPDNAALWIKLAKAQVDQRALDDAERSGLRALDLDNQAAEAWQIMQQIYALQRKRDPARDAAERWRQLTAAEKDRSQSDDSFQLQHAQSMSTITIGGFRSLAQLYWDKGEGLAAKRWLERALELAPNDAKALASLVNLHRQLGDVPQAVELNTRLLRIDPLQPAHFQNLANLYMQLNQPVEAEAALQLACRRLPDNGEVHSLLASFLLYLGKSQEALRPAQIAHEKLQTLQTKELLDQARHAR